MHVLLWQRLCWPWPGARTRQLKKRKAERVGGTFGELATKYVNEYRLALTRQAGRSIPPADDHQDRQALQGRRRPPRAVETEALSQALIVQMVRDWLDLDLPQPLDRVLVRERRERARLQRLIKTA